MNQKRPPDSQPARDASSAPEARQRRPSRSDGQTAQRWALSGVGAFGLVALFALAGCPANLEQPQRFADGGADGGGGGADPNALPACMTAMFGQKCAGGACHDHGTITNELDLTSSGVSARILDVPAAHSGLGDAGVSCMPAKLVDTHDGMKSWIYVKLAGMQGDSTTCGSPMPLGANVSESQRACYTAYFQALGGSAGGTGGAAAAGGSAGTASSSGGSGGAATGGSGGSGGATAGGGGSGGARGGASGSAGTGGA